jgi:hypothetical protein
MRALGEILEEELWVLTDYHEGIPRFFTSKEIAENVRGDSEKKYQDRPLNHKGEVKYKNMYYVLPMKEFLFEVAHEYY